MDGSCPARSTVSPQTSDAGTQAARRTRPGRSAYHHRSRARRSSGAPWPDPRPRARIRTILFDVQGTFKQHFLCRRSPACSAGEGRWDALRHRRAGLDRRAGDEPAQRAPAPGGGPPKLHRAGLGTTTTSRPRRVRPTRSRCALCGSPPARRAVPRGTGYDSWCDHTEAASGDERARDHHVAR